MITVVLWVVIVFLVWATIVELRDQREARRVVDAAWLRHVQAIRDQQECQAHEREFS